MDNELKSPVKEKAICVVETDLSEFFFVFFQQFRHDLSDLP